MLRLVLPALLSVVPSDPTADALHRVLEALEGVAEAAVDGHPVKVPSACRRAQGAWKAERVALAPAFAPEILGRVDQDLAQLSKVAPEAAALKSIDLSRRLAEGLPADRARALLIADLACMEASLQLASGTTSVDLRAAFAPLRDKDATHASTWTKIDGALRAFEGRTKDAKGGRSAVKQLLDLVDALEK